MASLGTESREYEHFPLSPSIGLTQAICLALMQPIHSFCVHTVGVLGHSQDVAFDAEHNTDRISDQYRSVLHVSFEGDLRTPLFERGLTEVSGIELEEEDGRWRYLCYK